MEVKSKGFYRFFRLGKNVQTNNIEAKYGNGLLTLTVPKKQFKEILVE